MAYYIPVRTSKMTTILKESTLTEIRKLAIQVMDLPENRGLKSIEVYTSNYKSIGYVMNKKKKLIWVTYPTAKTWKEQPLNRDGTIKEGF